MKECPRCKTQNRDTARFCKNCSIPLESKSICFGCGQVNSVTACYCRGCGAPLVTPQPVGMPVMPPFLVPPTGKLPQDTRVGDRYLISKLLGQGGMGAVYLVMDTRLGNKQCALKEMSDSAIQDPGERQKAIQAFRQEAQMLSCLSHPGLPRVTDFFSRDD